MAVVNIATILAQKHNVLVVDFDLEAPGVDFYFDKYCSVPIRNKPGLIELLSSRESKFTDSVTTVELDQYGQLDVLGSGRSGRHYVNQLTSFDWASFFDSGGGAYLEELRRQWKQRYDFVLIDSRTGITDSGGVCTIFLPDVLAVVLTPNYQSLGGIKRVIQSANRERQTLEFDRSKLTIFPLASRFEVQTEHTLSREWIQRIGREFGPACADWIPATELTQIIEQTKIPHIPYFSFGESIAALVEGTSDPHSMGRAFQSVARLFESGFSDAILLARTVTPLPNNRDDRVRKLILTVSALINTSEFRQEIWNLLLRLGYSPYERHDISELVDKSELTPLLENLGVIELRGKSEVALAEPEIALQWEQLSDLIRKDSPLLEAMSRIRTEEHVRKETVLMEGVDYYAQNPSKLTQHEKSAIASGFSQWLHVETTKVEKQQSRLWLKYITYLVQFLGFGVLAALVAGLGYVYLRPGMPVPSESSAIGALAGCLVISLAIAFGLTLRHRNRVIPVMRDLHLRSSDLSQVIDALTKAWLNEQDPNHYASRNLLFFRTHQDRSPFLVVRKGQTATSFGPVRFLNALLRTRSFHDLEKDLGVKPKSDGEILRQLAGNDD